MSQSDWQFILGNAYTFQGGEAGSAIQHVNIISNPLTSSGEWCRIFVPPSSGQDPRVAMIPINNSELTSSSGYEYGYAYSIRCWSRLSTDSNNRYTSLHFKAENNLGIDNGNYDGRVGYTLVHRNTLLQLVCKRNEGGYSPNEDDPNDPAHYSEGYTKNNIGSLAVNTWHRIRMDVTPISGAYDRITVYTAAEATPDTWVLRNTTDIPRLRTGAYVPWANNPNGDGADAAGKGYLGVIARSDSQLAPVYIDGFEVYKQKVV